MDEGIGPAEQADTATTRSAVSSVDGSDTTGDGAVLAIGTLVGRYRIRRLLGSGGMGRVYLARDSLLGRSVALKVIRRDRARALDLERFVLEARTTARLNHPHILVLYDVGEHGGAPY